MFKAFNSGGQYDIKFFCEDFVSVERRIDPPSTRDQFSLKKIKFGEIKTEGIDPLIIGDQSDVIANKGDRSLDPRG